MGNKCPKQYFWPLSLFHVSRTVISGQQCEQVLLVKLHALTGLEAGEQSFFWMKFPTEGRKFITTLAAAITYNA